MYNKAGACFMDKNLINTILKYLLINILTILIFYRILNRTRNPALYIKIFLASIFITTITSMIKQYISGIWIIIITFFLQLGFIKFMDRESNESIFVTNLIASALEYIMFTLASIIELGVKLKLSIIDSSLNLVIISIINVIIYIIFFKIKRFKKGLDFIQNKTNSEYIDIIMINISSVLIFLYCLFGNYYGNLTRQILVAFIILGIIMFIMIQKTLILYYKQKLLKKTLEEDKEEIANKDKKIQELSDEKFKISKLNHEFYNRQKSLELAVEEFVKNSKSEASDEIGIMDKIQSLSKEYSGKVEEIKTADRLYTTNIPEIDDMFKYMQSECKNNNIDFNLQINGNIFYMINNLIDKSRLVTLIGDHIRDAIIAINHSNNKNRSIIAILGMKDKYYEFSVYDTGIEFEIDTLLKLGLEPATTHKDEGGTGIGFITTFETLKETKASLVIEEKHGVVDNDYTKSVNIVFDGKNEYRIISYRSDEIKKKNKNGRIIIK